MNATGTADNAATLKKGSSSNGSGKSDYTGGSTQPAASNKSEVKQASLKTIFENCLREAYSAETTMLKAMPELAKAVYNEELQDAFNNHLEQTRRHVERLEKIFSRLGINTQGASCPAIDGLVEEVRKVVSENKEGPARDSALIIGMQKIEHYEIACYGSLCELADVLGYKTIADILDRTLQEEGDTDHLLTDIAKDINDEAMEMEFESQNGRF